MSNTVAATRIIVAPEDFAACSGLKRFTLSYNGTLTDALCQQAAPSQLTLRLLSPLLLSTTEANDVDLFDGTTSLGAGRVCEILNDGDYSNRNIRTISGRITEAERQGLTGHRGLVVWLTGLSGSGKSTIAQAAERRLLERGLPAYLLDGDRLRMGLTSDLGFSDADRTENQRRVAEVAALFRDAGMIVLVATISPQQTHRDLAREKSGGNFIEVYVRADYATCRTRDPKQLYQKAEAGDIDNFTGKGSGYQVPEHPDLLLDTMQYSADALTEQLLQTIYRSI